MAASDYPDAVLKVLNCIVKEDRLVVPPAEAENAIRRYKYLCSQESKTNVDPVKDDHILYVLNKLKEGYVGLLPEQIKDALDQYVSRFSGQTKTTVSEPRLQSDEVKKRPEPTHNGYGGSDLLEQLEEKDKKIDELSNRLSKLASDRLHDNNPSIADLADVNRPTKLAEQFGEIYDNEWTDAFESMKSMKRTEEDIVYDLLRVARYAYTTCESAASRQLDSIQLAMLQPTLKSKDGKIIQASVKVETGEASQIRRMATQYRKSSASFSIAGVQALFNNSKLPGLLPEKMLNDKVKRYINRTVAVLWLMCVQDPPMMIYWPLQKDPINNDYFKYYSKSGDTVKHPVWPAVFLHEGGPLMSKGFVLPY